MQAAEAPPPEAQQAISPEEAMGLAGPPQALPPEAMAQGAPQEVAPQQAMAEMQAALAAGG
jgi:hypothetical protein